jgi:N-methylhydantoinase B
VKHVTVTIKERMATFDFSASGPQTRGPFNLRPSMVEACVFYSLIGSLGPGLNFNDGMRDVLRLVFAPRTVTNAEAPAAVSNYQMMNLKLVDVILEALAHFNPERATANAGSSSALGIAWTRGRTGQSEMQYEILGSAYGGGMGHDGASATATHLSNLHNTPIEIIESEYPCRITRFELCRTQAVPGGGAVAELSARIPRAAGGRNRGLSLDRRDFHRTVSPVEGLEPQPFIVRLGTRAGEAPVGPCE